MIKENVKELLSTLPEDIELVAAAKTRTVEEIEEAIDAGIKIIGENYLQETVNVFNFIKKKVKWHFIGHLQKNKIKKIVEIFDMIETVDSFEIAQEINKRCHQIDKIMPALIEINSGREEQKIGVWPEKAENLIKEISPLSHIKIMGLMTMGPIFGDPEDSRPYFKKTRKVFENITRLNIPDVKMKYLSMGMTNSYRIAIEEKANVIRIGTLIFGERECRK